MSDAISASAFGSDRTAKEEISRLPNAGVQVFSKAVVIQTLCDPALRDEIVDADLLKTLRNPKEYVRAPRNSIICRLLAQGGGTNENSDYVCFPFFSSHIMMPIKTGEKVWIFFEQPESKIGRPYWISRIAEPLFVEDANFTHGDRSSQKDFQGDVSVDDGSGNFVNPRMLTFQNGVPSVPESSTLPGNQKIYASMMTGSKEYASVALEPVPRITKRPGDLVIQGSNNSSIRLGTMMGWDSNNRPTNLETQSIATAKQKLTAGLGSIDIVAGRGQIFQQLTNEKLVDKKKGNSPEKSTRPLVEETEIVGTFETDKNVATQQVENDSKKRGNNRSNPQEGDPDYLLDASRILLASKADIDLILDTGKVGTANSFENPIADLSGPSIAMKSDHIRIVARKSQLARNKSKEPADIDKENPAANGSIRIIKEGEPNKDLASITIEADGTIQISGSKIFLGRKTDDGGAGTGPGPGESQPYVRYQQLEDLLNKTFDDLKVFVQDLQKNFLANTTPGFGAPNPALLKSANAECLKLIQAIGKRKSEIETLKSERIFGE